MTEEAPDLRRQVAELGQKLRERREAQGLTIQNIATFTRISPQVLNNIEQGNLEQLPPLIFVRGFIRNYIQALAVEDGALDEELAALGSLRRQEQTVPLENPGVLEREQARFPWGQALLGLVLLALVAWVGYLFLEAPSDPAPQPAQEEAAEPATPDEAPEPAADQPASQAASGSGSASGTAPAAPAPQAPSSAPAEPGPQASAAAPAPEEVAPPEVLTTLRLTLQGLERTWVRVVVDEGVPVDVLLEPADSLSWEADEEFRLTVGRSQAVRITLEGETFTLPDQEDRLVTDVVLNRQTVLMLQN